MNYLMSKLGKEKFEAYDINEINELRKEMKHDEELFLLKSMVGNYEDIKPLNKEQEAAMVALAYFDATDRLLEDYKDLLKAFVEKELIVDITVLYLYANWRVWATYEKDKEVARKYQKINDEIDKIIRGEKKFKQEEIDYFVRETD